MIFLSSPAKTLDFQSPWQSITNSEPRFIHQASILVDQLQTLSAQQLAKTLGVSSKLAQLNKQRYQVWKKKSAKKNTKPAILAYRGDVYQQLQAQLYTADQQDYAQKSLRIISGLYGLLKPYDLILPYRLEMNTNLPFAKIKSLYHYWSDLVTQALAKEAAVNPTVPVLDLASQDYSKVIDFRQLQTPWLRVEFRQRQAGKLKNVGLLAKKARGMMIEHLIRMQSVDLEPVRQFSSDGYQLSRESEHQLLFIKKD